ncbi:MAG TPA: peptidylprolyl isomerase [Gemmatimonadales bacterium]|nr:peptidylprolyl isomerase [Gemmatimonadales bacterium]
MTGHRRFLLGLAVALSALSSRAAAQEDELGFTPPDTSVVVDRVAAVVGNQPILESQIDEQLFTTLSGQNAPPLASRADTLALRRSILDDMIEEEILVQEAARDTAIKVTEQEVTEAVNQRLASLRGQFTSEVDYRRELQNAGFQTPEEFRRYLSDQHRRRFLRTRLVERLEQMDVIRPVSPTEREMRRFYEEHQAEMGQRPAAISFRQIVVAPKAAAEAKQRAFALADSIAKALRIGGDFATAARRFSHDSASAVQGGDLGWQRRGSFERAFDEMVFRLRPGVISDPVETVFGYHVIQVERVQPTEVQARHILIIPETTPADVDSARVLADSIAAWARAGTPFDSLQQLHHDSAEEREAIMVPLEALPASYTQSVAEADSGAIVGPFVLPGPGGRVKFAILRITGRRAAGTASYADVEEQLRTHLAKTMAMERYVSRLRASTYVDIRTN